MPSLEEFRTCLLFSPSLSFAVAVVVKDIEFQHRPLLKARVHLLSVEKLVLNRICSNTPSNSNSLFSLLDPILSPLPDHVEFKSFYDGIREHQCSVSSSFISSRSFLSQAVLSLSSSRSRSNFPVQSAGMKERTRSRPPSLHIIPTRSDVVSLSAESNFSKTFQSVQSDPHCVLRHSSLPA